MKKGITSLYCRLQFVNYVNNALAVKCWEALALALRSPAFSFPMNHTSNSFKVAVKVCNMSIASFSLLPSSSTMASTSIANKKKLPILLFDIMDTIVRDPFYHDVPAFFRMSLKELIHCKHPTAWIEFEKGLISEIELGRKFFKDRRRSFDLKGLKDCMRKGYSYIEGVEGLLHALKQNNYEIHAFTNYPIWYEIIEEKLELSAYLSWTFCSCTMGKRKPESESYLEVLQCLKVEPASCIFIDDRMKNVEAAVDAGVIGLHFKNADSLREDLSHLGIDLSTNMCTSA